MSSILAYGGNLVSRTKYIDGLMKSLEIGEAENNPDLLIVNKEEKKRSIGIKQVREATKFLNEKPFSHKNKIVVINHAESLTTQAQNALLKTLEEHPDYANIILNAKTEDAMLETVISRCKRVRVPDLEGGGPAGPSAKSILKETYGEKLAWAADYAKEDREVVINTLEEWVSELRSTLNPTNAHNIEVILKIKNDLDKTNVSLKLALETLALKTK